MDGSFSNRALNLHKRYIDASNINQLLSSLGASLSLGFMSIDLDYNDWHIWRSILEDGRFRAVIVCVEYNSSISPEHALVVPYDSRAQWDGTHFYGSSLRALVALGKRFGYMLVACDSSGTNAFFVDMRWEGWRLAGSSALETFVLSAPTVESAYRRAQYTDQPASSSAEHDQRLSINIGQKLGTALETVSLRCPLSPPQIQVRKDLGSSESLTSNLFECEASVKSQITLCAVNFVETYGLLNGGEGGIGCEGDFNCAVRLLSTFLLRRRWLQVSEVGELEASCF